MNPVLRRVTLPDALALSELGSQTFYETFTGTCTEDDMHDYLEKTYSIEQTRRDLENDADHFYFAEVNGVPVGYIRFKEGYSGHPKLKQWKALECGRLYVKKEFHKKGIAQFLMDYFMEYAQSQGYEVVWLGVWEFNFRAQKFYSKYGLIPNGQSHDFPIGNTPQIDIYLWKFLSGETPSR